LANISKIGLTEVSVYIGSCESVGKPSFGRNACKTIFIMIELIMRRFPCIMKRLERREGRGSTYKDLVGHQLRQNRQLEDVEIIGGGGGRGET